MDFFRQRDSYNEHLESPFSVQPPQNTMHDQNTHRFGLFVSPLLIILCSANATFAATLFTVDQSVTSPATMVRIPVFIQTDTPDRFQSAAISLSLGDGGQRLGGVDEFRIDEIDYGNGSIFDGQPLVSFETFDPPALGVQIGNASVQRRDFDLELNPGDSAILLMTFLVDLSAGRIGDPIEIDANAGSRSALFRSDGSTVPLEFRGSTITVQTVPEPSTAMGLLTIAAIARWRRKFGR